MASALIAVLSEPIAVAKIPAINKSAEADRHFVKNEMAESLVRSFGRVGSGWTWQ